MSASGEIDSAFFLLLPILFRGIRSRPQESGQLKMTVFLLAVGCVVHAMPNSSSQVVCSELFSLHRGGMRRGIRVYPAFGHSREKYVSNWRL